MCGIIGYLGQKTAYPILIDGLQSMEYRGYDSAGLAIAEPKGIVMIKKPGKINALTQVTANRDWSGTLGLGHIRWATHGVPNEVNAHPHSDCKGKIFVVHNGIIENARDLRHQLIKSGHSIVSQTDTELVPHLIEEQIRPNLTLEQAVKQALVRVEGAYGLAIISQDDPGKIVAARLGSPLVLGLISKGNYIVASDVTAILRHTRNVIYLEDSDIVTISRTGYTISSLLKQTPKRKLEYIDWDISAAEKGQYPHFMKKEIFEQPAAIATSIQGRLIPSKGLAKLGGLESITQKLDQVDRLIILACGTAYYAGLTAKYMLEEYALMPVEVVFSSEFRYRQIIPDKKTAYLAISQSGETADTIGAINEAQRIGGLTLGIVNVVGSTVARITDAGVYNHIGPEVAVAATKSFTSQLTVLALLTLFLGRRRQLSLVQGKRIADELKALPRKLETILKQDQHIRSIAYQLAQSENMLYLARKYSYPIALEGALKMKEIAYVHAEGFASGETKHGPIALIGEHFPTVAIIPKDSVWEKNLSNLEEIKARHGPIIALTTKGDDQIKKVADYVITIPKTIEMLTPILSVVPLQLLAYYIGVARGNDVDKPRNLAKSVTVE